MSDIETPAESGSEPRFREPVAVRCPTCDSVVKRGDARCLMCGTPISADLFVEASARAAKDALRVERERLMNRIQHDEPAAEPAPEPTATPEQIEQPTPPPPPRTARPYEETRAQPAIKPVPAVAAVPPRWRPSPFFLLGIILAALFSICGGIWLTNAEQQAVAALTVTIPPTVPPASQTPTLTAEPTNTATPTVTPIPTETATPQPTDTPQPPRLHNMETGQTLIGLALIYDITLDSILQSNPGLNPSAVQQGQQVQIPWPTATPPLQAIAVQLGEETLVVDPSVCPPFYEIKEGDSIFTIAAQNRVPFEAMLALNYLTLDSIVRPGDVICIPQVLENAVLPPTPGPSPTPSLTPAPQGPQLLYPAAETAVEEPAAVIALQWLAVKDLQPNEWYMVEITDLTNADAHPHRGFTRQNSFQLPSSWRPIGNTLHQFQWQVTIVQVTGKRADGSFIYTYGGRDSLPNTFYWLGTP